MISLSRLGMCRLPMLILALGVAGHTQSTPKPKANIPPRYLAAPLDVTVENVAPDFRGHDITAVFSAIKKSSALKAKSEFESTAAFDKRRAGFRDQQLYGNLRTSSYLGFVVDGNSTHFMYDADSQILSVKLSGQPIHFILEEDNPILDGVLIRFIVVSRDRYIGQNGFGAQAVVDRTAADQYGVAFNQTNWLFPPPENFDRSFSFRLKMEPEEARAAKADGKLLLVCRLSEPWLRQGAFGYHPTITDPTETYGSEDYVQVSPEQVWLFHQKTGRIIVKLSEPQAVTAPAVPNLVSGSEQQVTPEPVRISEPMSQGRLIKKVQPPYPPLARKARIQGRVLLQATISKSGDIESLTLISGHPMLVDAAIEAVKQWKYKPYLLNGEPVQVETPIQVNFELSAVSP